MSERRRSIDHVTLPKPLEGYKRVEGPEQQKFSEQVSILVPTIVRGELYNGHLANFLRQHTRQTGLGEKKIGIIFLINDQASDKSREHVLEENRIVHQYLTLLSQGNLSEINALDVPKSCKAVAEEVIAKNILEIRTDYVHTKQPKKNYLKKFFRPQNIITKRLRRYNVAPIREPHYGKLRYQSFYLMPSFLSTDSQFVTIHPTDVDITIKENHYQNLYQKVYDDQKKDSNLTMYDLFPGKHEGTDEKEIGRDSLLYFDIYRFYMFARHVNEFLTWRGVSGMPTISGRHSSFFTRDGGRKLHPDLEDIKYSRNNEDYLVGTYLINRHVSGRYSPDSTHLGGKPLRKEGEVLFLDRLRTPEFPEGITYQRAPSDAEAAYAAIKHKTFTDSIGFETYNLASEGEGNKFLAELERKCAIKNNAPDFLNSDAYQAIFDQEIRTEQKKVFFRRRLMIKYLRSLQGNRTLEPLEQRMVSPYEKYFTDEIDTIKDNLRDGRTPEEIADGYFTSDEHSTFFNFDAEIHMRIVRIRALMRYAFEEGRLDIQFIPSGRMIKIINASRI